MACSGSLRRSGLRTAAAVVGAAVARWSAVAAAGSGTGTPPTQLLTTFIIINKIQETDLVQGIDVKVELTGSTMIASNSGGNRVTIDLAGVVDGVFDVAVTPVHSYAGQPDTSIGDPATNPPDRIWVPYTATITKQGNTFTSDDSRVTINGRNITIRLVPKWMPIASARSRNGHVPSLIVVHHTDDANHTPNYDPNFSSKINRSITAWIGNNYAPHYVIDRDGSVIKLGHESLVAWHASPSMWAGQRDANAFSVGIEIVHTNNVRPSGAPTYTEDFTAEQYTSLIALLEDLTSTLNIDRRNIVGHSDVGSNGIRKKATATTPEIDWPIDVVGRKSGDPGIKFDWSVLEAAGLGFQRMQGPIDFTTVYGGWFAAHPGSRIRDGAPGVTPAIIAELRADLTKIGYPLTTATTFDDSVRRCIMVFCEHFMGIDHQDSVSEDIAEVIKRIAGGIP